MKANALSAFFFLGPLIGPLFFFTPWEGDPRRETPEQRLARLSDPRSNYLIDLRASLYDSFVPSRNGPIGGRVKEWNGLFSWQEKERVELAALYPGIVPVLSVRQQALLQERVHDMNPREAVELIVSEGGDPNKTVVMFAGREVAPLEAALYEGGSSDVIALINRGADVNKTTSLGRPPLKILVDQCKSVEYPSERSKDVRLIEVAKAFVVHGADVQAMVPKEDVRIRADEQPEDITILEYAMRRCPDFVIAALGGKEAQNRSSRPTKPN